MKKKVLLLLHFLFFVAINAQETTTTNFNCKDKIEEYYNSFNEYSLAYEKKEESLKTILATIKRKTTLSDIDLQELKEKKDSIFQLKKGLDSIFNKYNTLKEICIENKLITEEESEAIFKASQTFEAFNLEEETIVEVPVAEEPVVYTYLSDDMVIANDILGDNADTPQGRALTNALSKVNDKSYLGDITIPKENQVFKFYEYIKDKNKRKDENQSFEQKKDEYKFKKIELEIKDGNFSDIQVLIEYKGKLLWFENYQGINMNRFSDLSKKNYIFYSQKNPDVVSDNGYMNLRIRLSDVLSYKYKIGNNYIPYDLTLELPQNDVNNKKTNEFNSVKYEIKENTYLDKILELRAFSDFLALFGESENGLLQIEGKAKFYLKLLSSRFLGKKQQVDIFKSFSPFVSFSKFQDDNGSISLLEDNLDAVSLSLLEKRYLAFGGDVKLLEFYRKSSFLKIGFYGRLGYNITKVKREDLAIEDIKSLSYGAGVEFSSKRFNNFGFNYKLGIMAYEYENYNTSNTISTNFTVPVMNNEVEVFYHPSKNPNQAVFLRFIGNNYKGDRNDFYYQLQFGYKFSLGSRVVSK